MSSDVLSNGLPTRLIILHAPTKDEAATKFFFNLYMVSIGQGVLECPDWSANLKPFRR